MILLIGFAFLAGIVTILSPCILPVLPIILSSTVGGQKTGYSRPFGIVVGFVASFTFFTLFLSTLVRILGIPADSLRLISVVVIIFFGVSLIIPKFQLIFETVFSRLAKFAPQPTERRGFGSGVILGLSLGLLWTPCVGPILASVISLAITGAVSLNAFVITFAYSLGTAIPMFAVIVGGQKMLHQLPGLYRNLPKIQKSFGLLMILTAIGILTGFDRKFQSWVLNTFPGYGQGLTKFEDVTPVKERLKILNPEEVKKTDMGKPMFDLIRPKGEKAPEIIPGGVWFNSETLTLTQLQGKVVVVDFWTYSCINCIRTLPYLRTWWEKYKDQGLVIIGVHSPEFEFEKSEANVARAIADFGLTYPVVQDNDFATWRAYGNRYWPAKYFIDKEGYIRYTHFGEGDYDESEQVIQELLRETGVGDVSQTIDNPAYEIAAKTPETYLGYGRISSFVSNEQIMKDELLSYTAPVKLGVNEVAYEGDWTVTEEYASPQAGAKLYLNFDAKEVFLVMRPKGDPSQVKVYLDDRMENFGEDVKEGTVSVTGDRLYKLISLPVPGRHTLRLEFLDGNLELYAFTFG